MRAHLGRDDRRDRRRAVRAGVRVLPVGLDRRLLHRHRLVAAVRAGAASACCRSSPARCSSQRSPALVALPFGLGSAIYLSEYAAPACRGVLKPGLELLAGIPTIVFGYFALTFMTPLLRDIGIHVEIFNALAGGLVMGVMLIPTVASLSEDAMGSVPRDLRDGAYALGSTKMQVATRDRRPGGRLRDHRLVRAGDLARDRRDDDRARRRRAAAEPHRSTRARRWRR